MPACDNINQLADVLLLKSLLEKQIKCQNMQKKRIPNFVKSKWEGR